MLFLVIPFLFMMNHVSISPMELRECFGLTFDFNVSCACVKRDDDAVVSAKRDHMSSHLLSTLCPHRIALDLAALFDGATFTQPRGPRIEEPMM